MDTLDEIIAEKRIEIELAKKEVSLNEITKNISTKKERSFKQSLVESPFGIIAEFKRRSPSKGWIFEDAKVEEVVPEYAQAGASTISVLTNKPFFGGTYSDLQKARELVSIPLLNKDFIIDEYQLYQAKAVGADVILLIAAALTIKECNALASKAHGLGLEVLLEIHSSDELNYISEFVDVVGVNNRHLGTFKTDVQTSFDLSLKIPDNMVKIAESGITSPETVQDLRAAGFCGFLIGERFMRTHQPGSELKTFIEKLK